MARSIHIDEEDKIKVSPEKEEAKQEQLKKVEVISEFQLVLIHLTEIKEMLNALISKDTIKE